MITHYQKPMTVAVGCVAVALGLACMPMDGAAPTPEPTAVPTPTPLPSDTWMAFELIHIDSDYNGDHRPGFVAPPFSDLDGDGDIDVVAGGGYAMNVYEAPPDPTSSPWTRHVKVDSSPPDGPGANGGVMYDVNGDSRPDLITGWENADGAFNVVWFESPSDPMGEQWTRHVLDDEQLSFVHDVILADVDNDGVEDELVVVTENRTFFNGVKWYDIPTENVEDVWPSKFIFGMVERDDTGLAVGDIDGDGRNDIVYNRYWFQAPVDPIGDPWDRYVYDSTQTATSNIGLADLNGDGRLDIVVAEGHSFTTEDKLGDIEWWEAPADPRFDSWTRHVVNDRALDNPENLAVVDMDGDGDLDIVTGELMINNGWGDFDSNVIIYENTSAQGTGWTEHIVANGLNAIHKLFVADIDGDGKLDLVSEGSGEQYVDWLRNTSTDSE